MKLATAEKATAPQFKMATVVAWVYAAVLVLMVVSQLFAFEDFIPLISGYGEPGGHGTAVLLSSLIVFTEVFALPFLLRMPLSPLMRWVSLACSLLAPAIWVKLAICAMMSGIVANSGLTGSALSIPTGFPALAVSLVVAILAIVSAWGLWPRGRK